jgi:sulfotransferase family protein
MGLELLYEYLQHPRVCPNPVFVIGAPRSGTHGLAYSLGQHSHLWTHGESKILIPLFGQDPVGAVVRELHPSLLPDWMTMFGVGREEILGFLGLGINALFTSRNPDKRWVDKTPDYVLIAPLLAEMFPTAKFLCIVRDGRRVVSSMFHYLDRFTKGQPPGAVPGVEAYVPVWARDFREACKSWREYVRAGMEFSDRYPDRCLTVVNEQLVAEPEAEFTRLFEFLGEPFETECVLLFRGFRVHSSFSQHSADLSSLTNLTKPISEWTPDDLKVFLEPVPYQDTRPWEDWTDEQRRVFAEEAGALMVRCGFASADELGSWGELKEWAAPAPPPSPANAIPEEVRQVVATVLPPEAVVTAVEPEGEKLLKLTGPESWQFPRTEGGRAADSLPADTGVAIANLKVLGAGGAAFLVVPHTAFGWLEGAGELQRHLTDHYDCYWKDERCVIYRLALPSKPASPARTWRAVKV